MPGSKSGASVTLCKVSQLASLDLSLLSYVKQFLMTRNYLEIATHRTCQTSFFDSKVSESAVGTDQELGWIT